MKQIFKKNRFLIPFLFTFLLVNAQNPDIESITNFIFEKTNQLRLEKNKSELTRNKVLDKMAQYHSDNMVKFNFFSHTDSFGDSLGDRAKKMDVKYSLISENIAYTPWFIKEVKIGEVNVNEKIASSIFKQWLNSPGHYKNMIENSVNEIGIGLGIKISGDSYILYSTQNFKKM